MAWKSIISLKGGRVILPFLFLILSFVPSYASDHIYMKAECYKPGVIDLCIFEGTAPYKIYKSIDGTNYELMNGSLNNEKYTEWGLNNGDSYWYRVVDSQGEDYVSKYTVPMLEMPLLPLHIEKIEDDFVHFSWNNFTGQVDMYLNGELIGEHLAFNEMSVPDLTPNTQYELYFLDSVTGARSNTVTFTTTQMLSNFIDKLDSLLTSLFIPNDNLDSDSDGLADLYEPLVHEINKMKDYGPFKIGEDTKNVIGDLGNNFNSSDDNLPEINIDFGLGYVDGMVFNVFDLSEFTDEIKAIRLLISACLWLSLFLYFAMVLIPKLKL